VQVICDYCNNCRDLDLCRDSFTRQENNSDRLKTYWWWFLSQHKYIMIFLYSLPIPLSINKLWYFVAFVATNLCKRFFFSSPVRWYWCCSNCNDFYSRELIEQGLMDAVQRRSMAFILQDLVCTKCHGVSWLASFPGPGALIFFEAPGDEAICMSWLAILGTVSFTYYGKIFWEV
jgi:DNA polymerase epsilon subunit 1